MADKQFWSGENSRKIDQRIVVEADLVLQTPALFGTGDHDLITDMPLLVDGFDGVTPVLTGASLTGALRAYLSAREAGYRQSDHIVQTRGALTEALFGGFKGDDDGLQSALIVDDAFGENFGIEMRDGVRIDPKTRTADKGKLFDMQVWQSGTTFPLRLELLIATPRHKIANADYQKQLRKGLRIALAGLSDGGITLGGRKKRGFGRIEAINWRVKSYNLKTASGLCDWLKNGHQTLEAQGVDTLESVADEPLFQFDELVDERHRFRMEGEFGLAGSLLIRSAGRPNTTSPDMVHLTNHADVPILSGTSVTGALRARAMRILNLFPNVDTRQRINDLFGVFGEDLRDEDNPAASRIIVEETEIVNEVRAANGKIDLKPAELNLVQNRVAIDRFTGGAKDSALFNEQPLFGKPQTRIMTNVTVHNPKPSDIGLLLLLLKDLWTGDLPLGGEVSVGRGRLTGRAVTMQYRHAADNGKWKTETWHIRQTANGLEVDGVSQARLEEFVAAVRQGDDRNE